MALDILFMPFLERWVICHPPVQVNVSPSSCVHARAMNANPAGSRPIEARIIVLRGQRVMLDGELARLYGVEVRALNQAVKRNADRFPADFAFRLEAREVEALRSQNVILETAGRGRYTKYPPHAFTEQGVAMLSSVLKSGRAARVNVEIMRAFVRLRQMITQNHELARRLDALEANYDRQFKVVFDAIRELMIPPATPPKRRIGFVSQD